MPRARLLSVRASWQQRAVSDRWVINMETGGLIKQIEIAFREEQYPGDDHLTQGSSMEAVEVGDFLRGRSWQDLRLAELARNHASLFFMTPEALHYYIAAFLIASVRDYNDSDQVPSSLLSLLNPFALNDSDYRSRFRQRYDLFNSSQKDAIRAFLEYLCDKHSEDFPSSTGKDQATQLLEWWTQQ
jgi:hypothetical protein